MKKTSKKLLASILVSVSLATIGSDVVYAGALTQPSTIPSVTEESNDLSYGPLSDIIGWRYKTENGQVYRRQYNYSKQQWIGEWEAC